METIGFVGVGKIGLPVSENLIKSGFRVLGYRRGRGVLDSRNPFSVTLPLAHDLWAEADVVLGVGSCLPKKCVTNDELAKQVDTSDDWIVQRTGIKQRHIAGPDETTATLGDVITAVRDVDGIGRKRAAAIKEAWDAKRTERELYIFLQTYGVSTSQCIKLVRQYAVDAYEEQQLEIVKPSPADRKNLILTARDLVARIRGVSFSVDGSPFDCFEQVYPVDGFTFYLSGRTDRQVLPQTRTGTWSISPHR